MSAFFRPEGIALIGATADESKLGFGVARNLLDGGYPGSVHLVGTKAGTLFDRPVYGSVSEVPDPVDLAVILIPAPAVPLVLEACGRRGIKAAVISSGGFREAGPEGAELEQECLEVAARYDIRLLGPNCIGTIDTHLPLDTTFLPPPAAPRGGVAFVSQSGAICAAVIDWSRGQGFGFSRLASVGNEADVSETDMLESLVQDPYTKTVTLYLESVVDGRRLVEVARGADKPIVAFKAGRFAAGRRAASSHTGALAGEDAAYDAAFRRAGILRALSTEQMFDWAKALASLPRLSGRRVAVLTNAGGPGVAAADALEQQGLELASFGASTVASLQRWLPSAASLENPVDMLASASPQVYARCLAALLKDAAVDAVLVILPPPPRHRAEDVAEAVIPIIKTSSKPVVIALMGQDLIREAADRFRQAGIPDYRFPARAAGALGALHRAAGVLESSEVIDTPRIAEQAIVKPVAGLDGWLGPDQANALLAAHGIPCIESTRAHDGTSAAETATELGFPVAAKVDSPEFTHKSDVGGVLLNLESAGEVRDRVDAMLSRIRRSHPETRVDGVTVQKMAPDGQEVAVGIVRDPQFGPLLMFGSGGVDVEGLGDVAFALSPVSSADLAHLFSATWAGRRLSGFRGAPSGDREGVGDVIVRLGGLMETHPEVLEVEINPLLVTTDAVTALDVRVRLGPDRRAEPPVD